MNTKNNKMIYDYGYSIISPILIEYVSWILNESKKKNIKKIYFLARDGYVLKLIAEKLIIKNDMDIKCRYLYCSRHSLRNASYHIIDNSEAIKYIFSNTLKVTIKTIFERCSFDDYQTEKLIKKLNIQDINKELSTEEYKKLKNDLASENLFWSFLYENSKLRYARIISYFIQEDVLRDDFVIVDSGWAGSIQQSLNTILKNENFNNKIIGFYFGMYNSIKTIDCGDYNTFYFNKYKFTMDKIMFNNNLFECMLAAPHGMTVDFIKKNNNDITLPVFKEKRTEKEISLVNMQIKGILDYVDENTDILNSISQFDYDESHKKCSKILRRVMTKPTREEVETLSQYNFCDDSTEGYFFKLVERPTYKDLNKRIVLYRVFRKIAKKYINYLPHKNYVWAYASISYVHPFFRWFYRINEYIGDYLRLKVM